MSGNSASWTPERRQAQRERMTARMADPAVRAASIARLHAGNSAPANREAAAERMRQLNERAREDQELKGKMVDGATQARRRPGYQAARSIAMAETMARPENREEARLHAIDLNTDPIFRARQEAGKRRRRGETE